MRWSEVPILLTQGYDAFAEWSFRNEVELDVIVVVVVVGIIAILLKEKQRKRRKLHRFLWGSMMKRKDRERYQLQKIEDAIVDAAMEMVHHGEMTNAEEQALFRSLAQKLGLSGLLPQKDVKRAVGMRLKFKKRFGLLPVSIPGKPEVTVDPTYKPNAEESSLAKSRFRQPAE